MASRTVADELEWGRRKLERAGLKEPARLALGAWAAIAGQQPGAAWLARLSSPGESGLVTRYRRAIGRLAAGAPLAAAVGTAAFRTLELTVTADVLIPRPETEGLVEQVLSWAESRYGQGSWGAAADIGTGSGAIALALAVEGRFDRLVATDVSPEALALASQNAERVGVRVPVEMRRGVYLEPLGSGQFSAIVANPPYLTTAEWEQLGAGVRDYEPRGAFDGGPDGMAPFRVLFAGAHKNMRPGALLALEVDSRRAGDVLALAHSMGWVDARIVRDAFGRDRYLLTTRGEGTT